MYCHNKKYEIRYTDVDFMDRLKLSSLLSLLEESACLSADELGFGYAAIKPKNAAFVILNWYIEFERSVNLGDDITVKTWPIKPSRLTTFRDFEVWAGEEKIAKATSRWCLVNVSDFSLLNPSTVFSEDIVYNQNRAVDKIIKIPRIDDGRICFSKTIAYSDYDHNAHANNTKYADYLLDVFTIEELAEREFKSVAITYVKQCKCGETIDFYRKDLGDETFIVEGRVGDELRIQLRIEFVGRT